MKSNSSSPSIAPSYSSLPPPSIPRMIGCCMWPSAATAAAPPPRWRLDRRRPSAGERMILISPSDMSSTSIPPEHRPSLDRRSPLVGCKIPLTGILANL